MSLPSTCCNCSTVIGRFDRFRSRIDLIAEDRPLAKIAEPALAANAEHFAQRDRNHSRLELTECALERR